MTDPRHTRPARRVHRDVERLDAARERLYRVYTTDNVHARCFRVGLEIMELHRAWFGPFSKAKPENASTRLSPGLLELMHVLAVFGERAQSELAEDLRVDLHTVRTRLDELVKRGLAAERVVERGTGIDYRVATLTGDGLWTLIRRVTAAYTRVHDLRQRQDRREELLPGSRPSTLCKHDVKSRAS